MGTTYDAGALLAAEANRRDLWSIHARSLQRGERPVVPAGVLQETHAVIERSVEHWREVVGGKLRAALQGAFILSRVARDGRLLATHLRQYRSYIELLFGLEQQER